jgi:hypothetical protein
VYYRIRVKGHLDLSWQSWFAGLSIRTEEAGTTVMSGSLPDQPALYAVLRKIDRLGLTLLALESSETSFDAENLVQEPASASSNRSCTQSTREGQR